VGTKCHPKQASRFLCTTATANDRVIEDISVQLGAELVTQRGPLARESLAL
jgi:ATP-dependent DNA helicase RecQ